MAKKKVVKKKATKRPVKKQPPRNLKTTKKSVKVKRATKLVRKRPTVTAEEKLYLLFKEDYEARQIFAYLRVETVGQLERYSPAQIVDLLTKPVQRSVGRIREKLASKYRHLSDDEPFLAEYIQRAERVVAPAGG